MGLHSSSDGFTLKSRRLSPDRVLIPICVGFSFLWFLFLDAPMDVRARVCLIDLAIKGVGMIPFMGITASFSPDEAIMFWDCCNCLGALSIAMVIAYSVDQSLFGQCDVHAHSCWAVSFYLYFSVTVIQNGGSYMVASRIMYALTWFGTVGFFYGMVGMTSKLALGMAGVCFLAMTTHVLTALRDAEELEEEQAEINKILEQQDSLGRVYEEMRAQHEELKSIHAVDLSATQISDLDTLVSDGSLRQLFSKHIAGEITSGPTASGSVPANIERKHTAFDMLDTFLRNVKIMASEQHTGGAGRRLQTAVAALTICDNWLQRIQHLEQGAQLNLRRTFRRSMMYKNDEVVYELWLVTASSPSRWGDWDKARATLQSESIDYFVEVRSDADLVYIEDDEEGSEDGEYGGYNGKGEGEGKGKGKGKREANRVGRTCTGSADTANVLLYIIDPSTPCTVNSLDAIKRICQGRQIVLVMLDPTDAYSRRGSRSVCSSAASSTASSAASSTASSAASSTASTASSSTASTASSIVDLVLNKATDLAIHRQMMQLLQAIAVEHGIAMHKTVLAACQSICKANHVSINNPGKLAFRDKVSS
jgi:hypothetical protein